MNSKNFTSWLVRNLERIFLVLILITSIGFECCNIPTTKQKTEIPKYNFKYNLYPQIEDLACFDGLLSEWLAKGGNLEEELLKKYAGEISSREQEQQAYQYHQAILKDFEIVSGRKTNYVHAVFSQLENVVNQHLPNSAKYKIFIVKAKDGSRVINAFSTGISIYITIDLLDFIDSDSELAYVLGHEIAHNVLGHCKNHLLRESILGNIFGKKNAETPADIYEWLITPFNQVQELECDLSSAYICYAAGYDPQAGLLLLHRFGELGYDSSLLRIVQSHPMPPKRLACLNSYLLDALIRAKEDQHL